MVSTQDLGPVTAYAIAVKYGYSGTEEEWANSLDTYRQAAATSAANAATSATDAEQSATNAKNSLSSISDSVIAANSGANSAKNSADSATASATSAANSLTAMQNTVAHLPTIGDNGNWELYDGSQYNDSGKPSQGLKGDKGDIGETGATGDAATITVGTITTLPAGSNAVVTNTGTQNAAVLNFALPKGADGTSGITQEQADGLYAGKSHTQEVVSSVSGVHGLRWYDNKLQAKNGDVWDDISTGGGSSGIAPADVSGLAATAGNKEVAIVWSDPADTVIEGVTLSKWAGSKLVRKEGAYPTNVTDGVLLVDNKTRDTYKTSGYVDANLTNGTTYYYAVFPYSDTGAINKDTANQVSAVPTIYPLPACTGISASAGNTQNTIFWSDPTDVEGKVTWAGSKLVRKEGSYPSAVTDGTLLIDNTTRDHYKITGYVDTGLTNGTTYYYMIFPYSTTGEITVNTANQVSTTPQAYVKYGVRWHKNQSSPTLERLYDSADFTFSATNGSTAGSSDFDDKPIYKDMKLCNVQNGAVTAYEGEAGFIRDGTNGDVCVEIPKFYYQVTDTADYRDFVISDGPLDGFLVAPRHAPCSDYPNGLDKIWVGTYEASSGYKSVSGAAPLVGLTRAQFRAGFAGRGAGYCQADWATQFELMILFIVGTASFDSQSIVGQGNTSTSAAINTGGSDSVTGLTGSSNASSTSVAIKWRGFENLWGNVYEWRDGINFNSASSYVCLNPSEFADNTSTNYTDLSYSKATSSGYISAIGLDSNTPWAQIPTVVSGSSSTYLCDEYYYSSGWRVPCVGGSWSNGSNAGMFYLYSNNVSSNCSSHLGSRLLVLPK